MYIFISQPSCVSCYCKIYFLSLCDTESRRWVNISRTGLTITKKKKRNNSCPYIIKLECTKYLGLGPFCCGKVYILAETLLCILRVSSDICVEWKVCLHHIRYEQGKSFANIMVVLTNTFFVCLNYLKNNFFVSNLLMFQWNEKTIIYTH